MGGIGVGVATILVASVALVASLTSFSGPAVAEDELDYKRSLTMLRLLAYDRNLRSRAPDTLKILVLTSGEDGEGERTYAGLKRATDEFEVAGRDAEIQQLQYSDNSGFTQELANIGPAAIYVPSSLRTEVDEIIDRTRDQSILSFTSMHDLAATGCSVAIEANSSGDKQFKLTINLASVRSEGADFPAKVLKIADETLQ